jgi:uncharacterized membrane protein YbhN (UPF0104 family)
LFGRIRKRTIIQLIIGVAILLWLLQLANLGDTFAVFLQANFLYLIGAAALFVVSSTYVAFALYATLRHSNPIPSIRKVVMASFAGQLMSDVTPVRSGYFLTPIFLNNLAGVSLEQGMTGVLATGAINAILKAIVCLIGLGYFASFLPLQATVINSVFVGVAVLIIAGTFLLFLMWENRISKFVVKLKRIPLVGNKLDDIIDMFANVQKEGRKIRRPLIIVAVMILMSLIVNSAALYFVFNGIWHNSSLSLLDFFLMASFASALTYIPITIAGLGVQEAGYVLLLQLLLGLPLTTIDPRLLAFALITRALFTGTDIIGIGPLLKVGLKKDSTIMPKSQGDISSQQL